jgi:hypothetical protein
MTDLLEQAVKTTRLLSPQMQDEIAHVMLSIAGEAQTIVQLTPQEVADLIAADLEVERGDFATDEELHSIWVKHAR